MSDLQFSEIAARMEASRVRLVALHAAGQRYALHIASEAFWCPDDQVDTWQPDSEISKAYLRYLDGSQDPRD